MISLFNKIIGRSSSIAVRYLSTNLSKISGTTKFVPTFQYENQIKALTLVNISKNHWIWEEGTRHESPKIPSKTSLDLPNTTIWTNLNEIQAPASENSTDIVKHAVRLIVIRRRKMKKHKLKKLRKRMKFEYAKRRQRRELAKEKLFQATLIAQIKDAERFSAEEYVNEKIRQATEKPLPRFWKGRRLPEFIIRQKLGLDKKA